MGVSLAFLASGLGLVGCSHPAARQGMAVPSAGGIVRLTPSVSLGVAAGTSSGTTVQADQVPNAPGSPAGIARAVGPAIDIRPSGPMAASTIRMKFDPAQDLPPARPGAAAPTVGNAFIAVLDEPTGTWLPLATRYDAATHELTAAAPHFSTFRDFVTTPGRFFLKNEITGLSIVIKAGESGLSAAKAAGDAVWQAVMPDFGSLIRRSLPADQRIDQACTGSEPKLPWDRRYRIYPSDENMKIRSCVVDQDADAGRPALLMENDYGFPVDVFPQKGAVLPGLATTSHPDQDALAALASLAGHGYIPGPGTTQIGFPAGAPASFTVQAQADWLGLATDVILTSAAIIPGFEASETEFTVTLGRVVTQEERDGQQLVSVTQTLRVVSNELKAEKGLVFETADHLATAYICFADLSKIVDSDSISDLAHKVVACAKELVPDPDRPITSGGIAVSEYAKYLDSLHAFAQLPAVLNDFREHGRQVFAIEASRAAPEQFQPFGLSLGNFTWSAQGNQITITPPLGANRYSALWGVFDGQQRCSVTVDLDSRLADPQATRNFGFAIAPLSTVQADQPAGASVQYEHEAPPDFPAAGSFLRPAFLPSGAWAVEVTPVPAADIYQPHHIRVTDNGTLMSVQIDGQHIATYSHQAECGGVSIRAWGAGFTFSNVVVSGN
jgi:hypothetical protein